MNIANQMIIIGNLGGDADVKDTKNGNLLAKFSVAVNKKGKDGQESTTWVNVQAWGKLAESCCNLKKGNRVVVIGEYVNNSRTTITGEKKYFNSLNAVFIAKPILSSEKNNQYNANHSTEEIPF